MFGQVRPRDKSGPEAFWTSPASKFLDKSGLEVFGTSPVSRQVWPQDKPGLETSLALNFWTLLGLMLNYVGFSEVWPLRFSLWGLASLRCGLSEVWPLWGLASRIVASVLKFSHKNSFDLVYDRNHLFGLGPIPKLKIGRNFRPIPKLTETVKS